MTNKSINECQCKFCGRTYIARNPRSTCCKDIQCLKDANREIYSTLNKDDFKYVKVCQVCGEEFWTNTKKAKCCNNGYCSGVIGGILSPIKKGFDPLNFNKGQCKQCGNDFDAGFGKSKVYCSDHCSDAAKAKKLNDNISKAEAEFVGTKFGKVTVSHLSREHRDNRDAIIAYFDCECGGNGSTRIDLLRAGYVQSCGCLTTSFTLGNHGLPQFLRRKISTWITDSRNNYDGLCDITGINENNAIHHLYPFANIVLEALDVSGLPLMEASEYTDDELRYLTEVFLRIHNEYPAGVCVSEGLHQLFHGLYSRTEFTPEMYYEFKQRCLDGEFGDLSEYNRSKRKDNNVIKQCHYCGSTDGKICGVNGKFGNDYCAKHYSQMISKGHCYEVEPPKPKEPPKPRIIPSGCPGVSWFSKGSKWKAMITINGKRTSLGYYKELQDAIDARERALQETA